MYHLFSTEENEKRNVNAEKDEKRGRRRGQRERDRGKQVKNRKWKTRKEK